MTVEWRLFVAGFVFFSLSALLYGLWAGEPAGTTALTLTAGLAALVGFYTWATSRRVGERPEDRADAQIDEAQGEYGFFSPHSWWPLPTAASAATIAAGIIFGWWLVILGIGIMAFSLIGMVFEYYRGDHAH